MHARPILAGNELLGWIGWFGKSQPDESARLVLSHVSLAVAMHLLERRNTTRARSQTLQSVLWDLLEGDDETRSAALDRARELKVPIIKQPVAVLVASIARGEEPATEVLLDEERDRVLDIVQRSDIGRSAAMFGIRGTQLRLICKAIETTRLREQILRLIREIQQEVPRVSMACGFSSPCSDVREMPSHLREASIALEVARYRRGSPVAAYSESGVLGLLINLRSEADVRRVAQEILGGLMGEPEASRKMLLDTLRTFFECDCSQAATALSLGAHQKTIAYRLSKVTKLTGLKLAKHQDRLLADIGTRLYFMLEMD
jgi:sugar diacid utilization regulator